MTAPFLPEAIQKAVGTEKHTVDKIGESGSEVRVYANYVLKIQPHSPETDNEYQFVRWINGRLPVPSIPAYEIHNGLAYTLMTKAEGKMLCDIDFLQTPELVYADDQSRGQNALRYRFSANAGACDRACGKGTENAVGNRCA